MAKCYRIISIVIVFLVLSGCATVSREDCLVIDWFETGRADGMQGKSRTAFNDRAKGCLKHGIDADRQAYYKGHDSGLASYCTEQNGFERGRQGVAYQSICPLQLEDAFRSGYNRGMRSYCSQENGYEMGRQGRAYRHVCPPEFEPDFRIGYLQGKELHEFESKIDRLHRRLEKIERKISQKEEALYSDHLSDIQRTDIRSELKSLDVEYREVSRELKYLENAKPLARGY